jgi:hypothetical protein
MDEYIDEFKDLIDQAGYADGLAVVMKFRKGLRRDIQDQIAQLAHGRPDDSFPEGWYEAALCCAENMEANTLFHGVSRTTTAGGFRNFAPTSHFAAPPSAPPPRPAPAQPYRASQNPVPMEIDAAKKKAAMPEVCYRCGEPGHRKPQCPRRFDVRHMTLEECEEWMQERALQQDAEEIAQKEEEAVEEDFPSRNE